MNILHITPHLGGGIGTVVCDWIEKDRSHVYRLASLDFVNRKAQDALLRSKVAWGGNMLVHKGSIYKEIDKADIVLVHYWDHSMLVELFSKPIPACRLAFWCHKNVLYPQSAIQYPDQWVDTSPIQKNGLFHIWSTGNMDRFLKLEPKPHEGFNIGTVMSPKIHPDFIPMCHEIAKRIPDVHFIILGDYHLDQLPCSFTIPGKVNDVAPYLAEMDVFGYPLKPDHYGTAEQALGEAMAAGVAPVVLNHQQIGFWVTGEEDYVSTIEWYYKYPEVRKLVAMAARDRASQIYSISAMINQWDIVFHHMMEEPKHERGVL